MSKAENKLLVRCRLLRQIGAVPHPHRDQLVPPCGELDLAVRDLRDPVFGHHRPDLPAAGRRG